jgi:multiple sugar transport system substrate-binding protein
MHERDRHAAIAAIDGLAHILRTEFGETAQAGWPILSVLLRNHLNDRQTTVTALADHSGLPRSSARRCIFALKAQGWLEMRPLSKHSSRAEVKPSVMLLDKLDKVTEQTIRLLVGAVDTQALDRFNAASLAPATDVAWPRPAASGFNDAIELTLLAYADPVFEIIKQNRADLERFLGMRLAIQMCPQDDYRAELGAALARDSGREPDGPMLVAIPFPWLAELSAGFAKRQPDLRLRLLRCGMARGLERGTSVRYSDPADPGFPLVPARPVRRRGLAAAPMFR